MIRDIAGQPRTRAEMRFAVGIIPCLDCGTVETVEPSVHGNPYRPVYSWTCPGCGVQRSYRFRTSPPLPNQDVAPPAELGGAEPSRIIAPDALAAEVRRLTPLVPAEPETLDPDEWKAARNRLTKLRICLNELAKFPGYDVAADRARLAAVHARYVADVPRYSALQERMYPPPPAPRGTIDRDSVRAHEAWVWRGCTGAGQLDVANVDARNLPFGACNLRRSRFEGVLLEGANAEYSSFAETFWSGVRACGARLQSTDWEGAQLRECELRGAVVDLGRLLHATVTGGDWDGVGLERALLNDAVFERVSLRNARLVDARLDGAVFRNCDLRGADLSADLDYLSLGTNAGTRFVDCDLRGTVCTGRRGTESTGLNG